MGKAKSAKKKATQTPERLTAEKIIKGLREWRSIGAIENWVSAGLHMNILIRKFCEVAPRKYQPNLFQEYRCSIINKLWLDDIFLTLTSKGKGDLASEITKRRDKLINEVNKFDKKLPSTSPMHLPNLQLASLASKLENALEKAFPCVQADSGQKPKKRGKGILEKQLEDLLKSNLNIPSKKAADILNKTYAGTYGDTSESSVGKRLKLIRNKKKKLKKK